MRRLLSCLALLSSLAACGNNIWASDAQVAKFRYADTAPKSVSLITVVNTNTGAGAHSALLVNGSERVVFDPAGTWLHPAAPERHDVHFGMSPAVMDNYLDFQTRMAWHAYEQTIQVTPEVAQMVLQAVGTNGGAAKATCANTVSAILHRTPGFESVQPTWYPVRLMKEFATLPGVKTRVYYDTDANDLSNKMPGATKQAATQ